MRALLRNVPDDAALVAFNDVGNSYIVTADDDVQMLYDKLPAFIGSERRFYGHVADFFFVLPKGHKKQQVRVDNILSDEELKELMSSEPV